MYKYNALRVILDYSCVQYLIPYSMDTVMNVIIQISDNYQ